MRRRVFLIGGLAALGAARAQQRTYRIAVLVHGPERTQRGRVEALRAGLKQHGYVEGHNLSLSVRWNENGLERLPALAAELLKAKPDVVVTAPVLAAAAVQKISGSGESRRRPSRRSNHAARFPLRRRPPSARGAWFIRCAPRPILPPEYGRVRIPPCGPSFTILRWNSKLPA